MTDKQTNKGSPLVSNRLDLLVNGRHKLLYEALLHECKNLSWSDHKAVLIMGRNKNLSNPFVRYKHRTHRVALMVQKCHSDAIHTLSDPSPFSPHCLPYLHLLHYLHARRGRGRRRKTEERRRRRWGGGGKDESHSPCLTRDSPPYIGQTDTCEQSLETFPMLLGIRKREQGNIHGGCLDVGTGSHEDFSETPR